MARRIWFAIMMNNEDNDWGYGSVDKAQALQMLETTREDHPDAYIAVIDDGDDPVCIKEIR